MTHHRNDSLHPLLRRAALRELALLPNDANDQEDDRSGRDQNSGQQERDPTVPSPSPVFRGTHGRILGPRARWRLS